MQHQWIALKRILIYSRMENSWLRTSKSASPVLELRPFSPDNDEEQLSRTTIATSRYGHRWFSCARLPLLLPLLSPFYVAASLLHSTNHNVCVTNNRHLRLHVQCLKFFVIALLTSLICNFAILAIHNTMSLNNLVLLKSKYSPGGGWIAVKLIRIERTIPGIRVCRNWIVATHTIRDQSGTISSRRSSRRLLANYVACGRCRKIVTIQLNIIDDAFVRVTWSTFIRQRKFGYVWSRHHRRGRR